MSRPEAGLAMIPTSGDAMLSFQPINNVSIQLHCRMACRNYLSS
jgi:hypothetical protein